MNSLTPSPFYTFSSPQTFDTLSPLPSSCPQLETLPPTSLRKREHLEEKVSLFLSPGPPAPQVCHPTCSSCSLWALDASPPLLKGFTSAVLSLLYHHLLPSQHISLLWHLPALKTLADKTQLLSLQLLSPSNYSSIFHCSKFPLKDFCLLSSLSPPLLHSREAASAGWPVPSMLPDPGLILSSLLSGPDNVLSTAYPLLHERRPWLVFRDAGLTWYFPSWPLCFTLLC